jgi:hypothetical protein
LLVKPHRLDDHTEIPDGFPHLFVFEQLFGFSGDVDVPKHLPLPVVAIYGCLLEILTNFFCFQFHRLLELLDEAAIPDTTFQGQLPTHFELERDMGFGNLSQGRERPEMGLFGGGGVGEGGAVASGHSKPTFTVMFLRVIVIEERTVHSLHFEFLNSTVESINP